MPFALYYWVEARYLPVGGGPMTQAFAQKLVYQPQPGPPVTAQANPILDLSGVRQIGGWPVGPGPVAIVVPGGEAPGQANWRLAIHGINTQPVGGQSGSMAGDVDAWVAANLGRIQGFATGGG